jgi:O-antigen/teichoic acid export membrane protein
VTFQSDRIIVSNFVGLSYVMYADVGGKLLSKIRALPLIMMSSLIPAVSQLGALNQTQRIRLAFDRSTKYLACCAIPLFVFVAAFAHLIMRIWMGNSFSMASFTLQILGLGYLLNVLTGTMSFVLLGMGNATTQMKVTIVQTVMNIAFSIAFVLSFGYYGVMIGTSLSLAISSAYFAIAFNKAIEGSLKEILIIMVQPVIASGVSVVVALIPWIIGGLAPHGRIVDFGLLTAGGLIFFLVYFAILRFTKYFDGWDVEFILRISPKLALIGRLISPREPLRRTVKAPR